MKLDNRNKTFTIKEAIKSIIYQLRICKQKTTNVTPFQAHFGRKPNTPLSNISTLPKSSNLSYENILHHYLDADTVPVEDYFGFESSVCSISDDSAAPVSKKQKPANPVIEAIIQEEVAQPPVPDTHYELREVSPPAPPPVGTWSSESYLYEDYAREISMSVFDAENQI